MRSRLLPLILASIGVTALVLCPTAALLAAEPKGPSLTELRETEHRFVEQHQRELQSLEKQITSQSITQDEAAERRFRVDSDFRRAMENLDHQKGDALRALELKAGVLGPSPGMGGAPGGGMFGGGGGGGASAVRIPSQKVITYPGNGDGPVEEQPKPQGRHKNVGIGVRELEY
jgi:hypothetical protein